jgi:cytochrome c
MHTLLSNIKISISSFISGLAFFASMVTFAHHAHADTEQLKKLMQANNCMACHMIDKRKYGPQFDEISSKYIGNKKAIETLVTKIKAGGTGVWGEDQMPPQPQVSDADAKTIAELIMALKPKE